MEDNRKIMAIKVYFGLMINKNNLNYCEVNNYTYTLLLLLNMEIHPNWQRDIAINYWN